MLVVKILRFSPAVRPILAVFCADARVRTARLTAPVRAAAGAVGPPRVRALLQGQRPDPVKH